MQPAAWPARDAQILERQSALLERIVADRASAMARAAAASQTEAQQGRRSPAAQTPRVRQIDLLTGEQWPAAPLPVVPPYTARATSVPHSGRQEVALPPLPPLPPRVRTRMPPSSPPAEEAGRVMAMPSWSTRPSTAAPGGSPRDPDVLGSPLDAAPGDYLCPIRCASSLDCCCGQPPGLFLLIQTAAASSLKPMALRLKLTMPVVPHNRCTQKVAPSPVPRQMPDSSCCAPAATRSC